MLNFQDHHQDYHAGARSMAELCPWLFPYGDRLIVCKDSALLACFKFNGIDGDSVTTSRINRIYDAFEQGLGQLRDKPVILWSQVRRRQTFEYPDVEFPDPISAKINAQRREEFLKGNNYLNTHYFSIAMLPDNGRADRFLQRLSSYMASGEEGVIGATYKAAKSMLIENADFKYTAHELDLAVREYESAINGFLSNVSDLQFRRLTNLDGSLGGYLKGAASINHDAQKQVQLPDSWMLDGYLSSSEIAVAKDHIIFDTKPKKYCASISIKEWPKSNKDRQEVTYPGILDGLLSIPGEITLNHVFKFASKSKAQSYMKSAVKYFETRMYSKAQYLVGAVTGESPEERGARPNEAMAAQAAEAATAESAHSVNQFACGDYHMSVLVLANNQQGLDSLCSRVSEVIADARLVPLRESIGTLSAFAGSIPGQWGEIGRWHFLTTPNLTDLMPLLTISQGDQVNDYLSAQLGQVAPALAIFPTDLGTPFYFNTYYEDLGHMGIAGPSRTGKSVMINFLCSQVRKYCGARILEDNRRVIDPSLLPNVISFDKDFSSRIPILLHDGSYHNLNPDAVNLKINPLCLLSKPARHIGFLVRWLEEHIICTDGYVMKSDERVDLQKTLIATSKLDPSLWRLSSIYSQIASSGIKMQLEPWIAGGVDGHLFDNIDDEFRTSGWTGFETGKLLTNRRHSLPFMSYAFYRIADDLTAKRDAGIVVPTIITIAEAWHLFKEPRFANELNDWLKTLAKMLGVVWLDSQSPEDYTGSSIWPSLRDNVPTWLFLPNDSAEGVTLSKVLEQDFELNQKQIAKIAKAVPKKDYFFKQKTVARMVSPKFDQTTLAILRSDGLAQAVFNKWWNEGNPLDSHWKENYIRELIRASHEL